MSQSTTLKQQELLNAQLNAEETHKPNSSELWKIKPIPNTPFTIMGNEEQGYALHMGKYRLSETMEYEEQVETHIRTNMWELILKIGVIINEDLYEQRIKLENKPVKTTIHNNQLKSTL